MFDTAQRELERLRAPSRQLDKFQEFEVLAPLVDLAVQRDGPPRLTPVADRRECVRRSAVERFPEVQHDGLPRGNELEPIRDRDAAIGVAIVLAPGEEGAVRLEVFNRFLHAVVDVYFMLDRIGSEINEPVRLAVLRPGDGAAMEVKDERRVTVQARQRFF